MFLTRPIWRAFDWLRQRNDRKTLEPAHALGRRGEDLAHRYLERHGYAVVQRNWRSRTGLHELDLIAWMKGDPMRLIVVEVKSRTSDEFTSPDRNVDRDKRQSIRRAASEFCRKKNLTEEIVRFDTVSVVFDPKLKIEHNPDSFGWREQ